MEATTRRRLVKTGVSLLWVVGGALGFWGADTAMTSFQEPAVMQEATCTAPAGYSEEVVVGWCVAVISESLRERGWGYKELAKVMSEIQAECAKDFQAFLVSRELGHGEIISH